MGCMQSSRCGRISSRSTRWLFHLLLAALLAQVALGIATLIYIVPAALAAAHQAGALLLLSVALLINHRLRSG
jgi:cytochrome c oxidase assembly protein subunit 15